MTSTVCFRIFEIQVQKLNKALILLIYFCEHLILFDCIFNVLFFFISETPSVKTIKFLKILIVDCLLWTIDSALNLANDNLNKQSMHVPRVKNAIHVE